MESAMTVKIPDTQNQKDDRSLLINKVGIKSFKFPLSIEINNKAQPTIATLDLYTELAADKRGTHMSRFIEVIEAFNESINYANLKKLNKKIVQHCEAKSSTIMMKCTIFIGKAAPISKKLGKLDYELLIESNLDGDNFNYTVSIIIPVKSLCPCSKAISKYGAHNQRSHVNVSITNNDEIDIYKIIKLVEEQASCEIYSVLKREDEKYVTEQAYENPKFVEDAVRDISITLRNNGYKQHTIGVENFESIHNHSAYALITSNYN